MNVLIFLGKIVAPIAAVATAGAAMLGVVSIRS
jgi:hypothetical protein